jgi:hypothetical protein
LGLIKKGREIFFHGLSTLKAKKPWSSRRLSTALTLIKKDQRRKILPVRFHHHQLLSVNIVIVVFINGFQP